MIAKKQAAKKRRLAKKNQKLLTQDVQKSTHQQQSTTQYDETNVEISEFKKKRGRPRKDDTHATDDMSESLSKSSKKKGKNKRIEIVDFSGSSDQPKNVNTTI